MSDRPPKMSYRPPKKSHYATLQEHKTARESYLRLLRNLFSCRWSKDCPCRCYVCLRCIFDCKCAEPKSVVKAVGQKWCEDIDVNLGISKSGIDTMPLATIQEFVKNPLHVSMFKPYKFPI